MTKLPSLAPIALAILASLLLGLSAAAPAHAASDFGLSAFDGMVSTQSGDAYTQAAGHPYSASTTFDLKTDVNERGKLGPAGSALKDISVQLPAGLVGNPTAVPTCPTVVQLIEFDDPDNMCPAASQVGVAEIKIVFLGLIVMPAVQPIFNMEPRPGVPAEFGINLGSYPVFLDAELRDDGDYGLNINTRSLTQGLTVVGTKVTLWGTPANPSHDAQRCMKTLTGSPPVCGGAPNTPSGPHSVDIPERAFLTNPTACTPVGTGLMTSVDVSSYRIPPGGEETRGHDHAEFESHNPPGYPLPPDQWGAPQGPTDCDDVPFEPQINVSASSHVADSPTGLDVEIDVPQDGLENPDGIAAAHLKQARVTLPEGMSVSPSAADGLGDCSPEDLEAETIESEPGDGCPSSSKVGSVRVDTPLLPDPLQGSVFVAEQDNNPFDSLLALYLVVRDVQRGVIIKLAGEVDPDPETGQLTAIFDDNPQLPFTSMKLHFKNGPRAPLATPATCGTKTTTAEFSPWSAADPDNPTPAEVVTSADSFEITSGPNGKPCVEERDARPFEPHMNAGVVNPVAGSSSPFVLRIARADGDQEVDRLTVNPPEGVAAVLRNAEQCSDGDIAANDCPEASRVGKAIVGAGPGSNPFYVDGGEVFFAGPYDPDGNGPKPEAPLSLDIQVPAVAGPFDLGIVNVRSAIYVDPQTAQLTIESDPLPQILEGIPLRVRDIRVKVDKPGFMVAPTDCDPKVVRATAFGINGAEADLSRRFQVGDCAALAFDPKLRLKYRGKGSKKRNSHPRLTARLKVPQAEENFDSDPANDIAAARQANLSRVRAVLPKGTYLDQDSLSRVCTPTQWEASDCPADSKVGSAKAWSPLLAEPLKGPVYLKVSENQLPDLAADLDGIVDIDLFGKVDQSKGRIRNTFQVVPDVPVSKFKLNITGGEGGLLVNSKDICKGRKRLRRANVRLTGQNEDWRSGPQMVAKCRKKHRG